MNTGIEKRLTRLEAARAVTSELPEWLTRSPKSAARGFKAFYEYHMRVGPPADDTDPLELELWNIIMGLPATIEGLEAMGDTWPAEDLDEN